MQLTLHYPILKAQEASGHLLGYSGVFLNLQDALVAAGVEFVDDAPVVLHIAPPHMFSANQLKYNVLLSMWETRDLPHWMARAVAPADLLIVPSSFCRTVFRRAGFTKPIVVVPLGIHAHEWPDPPPERPPTGRRRFLWLGSQDPRKGHIFLQQAWQRAFGEHDPVRLTVKTSSDPGAARMVNTQCGPVTFLTHKMPWPELRQLYLSHEVYVNTAVGEGFGLIALEALAAGMLVISPAHTGLRDFVHKGVAWLVDTEAHEAHYGVPTTVQIPKISHLASLLRRAVDDYETTASLRARAAAWARTFTWARTASEVLQAIQRHAGRWVA